jgi:hypothetical protein
MKYYGVYKVFYEGGKKDMWLYGAWQDKNRANEVGVEVQECEGCYVEIVESEEYPEQHLER